MARFGQLIICKAGVNKIIKPSVHKSKLGQSNTYVFMGSITYVRTYASVLLRKWAVNIQSDTASAPSHRYNRHNS